MTNVQRLLIRTALLFALVAFALALAAPAPAQTDRGLQIAVIDMQLILRDAVAVRGLQREIDKRRSVYQEELRKKEEALRNSDQELARQQTILSADAFAQKRKDLEQQVAALQREIQERKRGMEAAFGQGMRQVRDALIAVSQDIAQERGVDLLLAKATVVLVKPDLDITAEALKRLNAKLPSVVLPVPQN